MSFEDDSTGSSGAGSATAAPASRPSPCESSFFEDIKRYVDFGEVDAVALRRFLPAAEPHFARIAANFYRRIQGHPGAHAALTGGDEQILRLKRTLVEWMWSGLAGPHDEAFFERRARIGRVHVRINLPQQYMFTAMDVIRLDFREVVEEVHASDPAERRKVSAALDKLFDLELAIMLETYRQDSEDQIGRRERLASIGQLAGNVAHDLRNPLGVIESSLYLVRKRAPQDARLLRQLGRISEHVAICTDIINDLLEMARTREARCEDVNSDALVDQALSRVSVPPEIEVVRRIECGSVWADRGLLAQALANLIGNAVQAYDGQRGSVTLRVASEGERVAIEVVDGGPGFDPAVLGRVFEPLVTSKAHGTGLGMALVKSIAQRHGGSVAAGNRDEGGAFVRLLLPARDEGMA